MKYQKKNADKYQKLYRTDPVADKVQETADKIEFITQRFSRGMDKFMKYGQAQTDQREGGAKSSKTQIQLTRRFEYPMSLSG